MLKKIANVLGWVVVVFLFCFGLYGGWQMTKTLWPGLHDDGVLYSTVIINRASGNGNTFAVYSRSLLNDDGDREFDGHGQLYYPLVASLLSRPDYEALLIFLHQTNLFGFLLAVVAFSLATRRSLQLGWLPASFMGVLGGAVMVAILQYLQGRSEHGIPFIILLFILIGQILKLLSYPNWFVGLQIGLIACISPLPGVIAGLGSVFHLSTQPENKNVIRASLVQAVSAVASWLGVMVIIYDKSIAEWFGKTFSATSMHLFRPIEILTFWGKLSLAPGLGIIFLATVGIGSLIYIRTISAISPTANKILATISGLGLAYFIFKHGVVWASTNYCFLGFFPAIIIWIMQITNQHESKISASSKKLLCLILFLALSLPALGYFRTSALQYAVARNSNDYKSTLKRVENIKKNLGESDAILIHDYRGERSPVVFDSPPWRFRSTAWTYSLNTLEKKLHFNAKYFLSIQWSGSEPRQPDEGNFRLIENRFNSDPVYFMGIKIKDTTPGYGYAIYEKQ
jgi:hypothetical protein